MNSCNAPVLEPNSSASRSALSSGSLGAAPSEVSDLPFSSAEPLPFEDSVLGLLFLDWDVLVGSESVRIC